MIQLVKPVSVVANVLNHPRSVYINIMKMRLNSELKGIITFMEFYRANHSDVIIHSNESFSADEILNLYRTAFIDLNRSTALCDVRKVKEQITILNKRFNSALESVFFAMTLIHGFVD